MAWPGQPQPGWNHHPWDPWQQQHLQPPPPPQQHWHHGRHQRSRSHGSTPHHHISINAPSPSPPRGRSPYHEEMININVGSSRSPSPRGMHNDAYLLAELERERLLRGIRESWPEEGGRKKKKKDEVDEELIIERYEQKKAAEKKAREEAEKRAVEEHERKIKEEKEREEREWADFLRKQKEKKEKEEKEQKEKEEELEREMRERLRRFKFTETEIDAMVAKEKIKTGALIHVGGGGGAMVGIGRTPVYPMVHKKYLDTATLRYFNLPWEYDQKDPNYIIILEELDHHGTQVLFEHTKRLRERNGRLLDDGKKKGVMAFVRPHKGGRSRSRSRNGWIEIRREKD